MKRRLRRWLMIQTSLSDRVIDWIEVGVMITIILVTIGGCVVVGAVGNALMVRLGEHTLKGIGL